VRSAPWTAVLVRAPPPAPSRRGCRCWRSTGSIPTDLRWCAMFPSIARRSLALRPITCRWLAACAGAHASRGGASGRGHHAAGRGSADPWRAEGRSPGAVCRFPALSLLGPRRAPLAPCSVERLPGSGRKFSLFAKLGNSARKLLIRLTFCREIGRFSQGLCEIRCILGRREFCHGCVASSAAPV
jgi:hypothetical protein